MRDVDVSCKLEEPTSTKGEASHDCGWSMNEDHSLSARATTLEMSLGLSRMLPGEKK